MSKSPSQVDALLPPLAQLDHCMIADRHRLRREINRELKDASCLTAKTDQSVKNSIETAER